MALFSRFSEVLSANLHGLLDKFEDPVRMAKLFVREMEQGYEKAKLALAHQVAAERRLNAQREQARGFADAWSARAADALRDADEALAREALRHKIEQLDTAEHLDELIAEEQKLTSTLRSDLKKIEEKLSEMRRQRDALIAQQGVREAAKRVSKMSDRGTPASSEAVRLERAADCMSTLSEESRALAEIEGAAVDEVAAAFEEAELSRRVDEDLERLKREAGRT